MSRCILSPCLFNLHAEYIMRKAQLEEAQTGIKIAGRNINNLRDADDTTLMVESEEELKSLLMKVMVPSLHGKWINSGNSVRLYIWGSKITADGNCSHEIKRRLLLGRKAMTNLGSTLKCRGITLPRKVPIVKAMVFPVVMYGCESWTVKKAEHRRIDAFELRCWRGLLRVLGLQRDQTSQF